MISAMIYIIKVHEFRAMAQDQNCDNTLDILYYIMLTVGGMGGWGVRLLSQNEAS